MTGASRRKGALLSEQTQLQAGLQQAQTELRTQEVAIATRQGEFNALQIPRGCWNKKLKRSSMRSSLAAQEAEGAGKRQNLAEQAAALEGREQQAQAGLSEWSASLKIFASSAKRPTRC